jgi:hypothetical protein
MVKKMTSANAMLRAGKLLEDRQSYSPAGSCPSGLRRQNSKSQISDFGQKSNSEIRKSKREHLW